MSGTENNQQMEGNEPNQQQGTNNQQAAGNEPSNQQGSTYTPPATQAELDNIIESRLKRERAKYSDYNDLKQKAEHVDALTTERDSLNDQVKTLKAENETYKQHEQVAAWRNEVSNDTGIPSELLTADTKEGMEAQAKTLGKYINVSAPIVSGDGKAPNNNAGAATRDIFANALEGVI